MKEVAEATRPAPGNRRSVSRRRRKLLIAVPLYKAPGLIVGLFGALTAMSDEIRRLRGYVVLINDSPGHEGLRAELDARLPAFARAVKVDLMENVANMGFVQTANRALDMARERGHDVLLLNSDTLPTPGSFAELAAVARIDPMTAAVSPRSDNATLCNSPVPLHYRDQGLDAALAAHRAIERHLPRLTYAPTVVGFCMFIPHRMLADFGLFDEAYGGGYNEENDFIRRCNRRGYRAVLANRAYVHHLGSVSFGQSDERPDSREARNGVFLRKRYPEHERAAFEHFRSADYRAQWLLSGLIPDQAGRLRVLFDARALATSYHGTSEHTRRLVGAFAAGFSDRFDIAILASEAAFRFHGFDAMPGVRLCDPKEPRERPFAVAFRVGQPFTPEDLVTAAEMGAIGGYLMLDTISLDCQQLDEQNLARLWATTCETAGILAYNSEFVRDQFHRRFDVPGSIVECVAPCSMDVVDYAQAAPIARAATPVRRSILLVGNHYPHKHVREMVEALREGGCDWPITVLGVPVTGEGVTAHVAGELPQDFVDQLYADASLVLFPSHYEGFGLPILHALARGKPIVARDLPPALEIKGQSVWGHNIHLGHTTADLVELVLREPEWQPKPSSRSLKRAAAVLSAGMARVAEAISGGRGSAPHVGATPNWASAASTLAWAFTRAVKEYDFAQARRRQVALEGMRILQANRSAERRKHIAMGIHANFTADQTARWIASTQVGAPTLEINLHGVPGGLEEAQSALLRQVRDATLGSPVRITFPKAIVDATHLSATELVPILIHDAGCNAARVVEENGRIVADAIRFRDWAELMPDCADDVAFVEESFRHGLGREIEPAAAAAYAEHVRNLSRIDILAAIFSSAERRQVLIASQRG